jgi:hypothetical protein
MSVGGGERSTRRAGSVCRLARPSLLRTQRPGPTSPTPAAPGSPRARGACPAALAAWRVAACRTSARASASRSAPTPTHIPQSQSGTAPCQCRGRVAASSGYTSTAPCQPSELLARARGQGGARCNTATGGAAGGNSATRPRSRACPEGSRARLRPGAAVKRSAHGRWRMRPTHLAQRQRRRAATLAVRAACARARIRLELEHLDAVQLLAALAMRPCARAQAQVPGGSEGAPPARADVRRRIAPP